MIDAIARAIKAHETYRVLGDPARPDGYECAGCGHVSRDYDERLEHRASAVLGAWAEDT